MPMVRDRRWSAWAMLPLAMAAASILGCASTETRSPRAIGPNDLPMLAGTWTGTIRLPSGRPEQGAITLSRSGDYTTQAGAFSAQGKAQVKDGALAFEATSTTGGGGAVTGPRSGAASLSERPDGTLVLKGFGHSSTGPFDFEVTRRK